MFENLNPEQRAAVDHDDRPLLVLAGAGTGKTATLAARLARLLRTGVQPERICLLTFSRRAAAEMLVRAGRATDSAPAARVVGGTFHSVAQRLLHRHGSLIGLDPGFTVLDAADSTELMGLVRSELGLAVDDLLLLLRAMGTTDAGARVVGGLFDHVLVDECQDVNGLQADAVELLRPAGFGVTAVGDDAQAIYGFRAASAAAILEFPHRYSEAVVLRLEHNYRSTPPILALANQVMQEAPEGATKELWSERPGRRRPVLRTCADQAAEAEAVCDSMLAHREAGVALRDQAVLFRAGHHASTLELALGRRRIPYVKYGGLRFLEAAHVKDLLALLRVLDNPWDELAWSRLLRLLEGVGPAIAARVMEQMGVTRPGPADPGTVTPLARLLAAAPTVPEPARGELAGLRTALGHCSGDGGGAVPPAGA
ncbi:MAG: ATP-dependent helicase, partial [Actinomycetota bacterium]|nr:ATP-dependent helicase [Actinomycetota bacterium]